ncbi:hypothetical protein GGR22_002411 [Flavobacterium gossypii]|uniref:Uncharacterized protein n=1 Tax=Flavobacterium gossypii TaxID=1646119 RepID=A0ABR6DRC4_9FLAO|nr:hypothetical protein [Flavobacterium gossypii]MBA9074244.1 hypothetical protein [Flavobacterium gossypii]
MPFVNQYSRDRVVYAEEFIEREESFIYSISHIRGLRSDDVILTKTDAAGEVVWKKKIQIRGEEQHANTFKIIQLQEYYVMLCDRTDDSINSCHFIAFGYSGNQIWTKKFDKYRGYRHADPTLIASRRRDSFFLMASIVEPDENVEESTGGRIASAYVTKFDANGNFIKSKLFFQENEAQGIVFRTIDHLGEGFVIGGSIMSDYVNFNGLVVSIDTELEVLSTNYLDAVITQIFYLKTNDQGQIAAVGSGTRGGFLTLFTINNSLSFNFRINWYGSLALSNNHIYSVYSKDIVHKYNLSLGFVWSKKIDIHSIASLSYNPGSDHLTLVNSPDDKKNEKSIIAYTDAELNSCKTSVVENPVIPTDKFKLNRTKIPTQELEIRVDSTRTTLENYVTEQENLCGNLGPVITENAALQSSHFYLQAAGSRGADSTKGIHLRWSLKGSMAYHLPKANYATNNFNFNKQDDFVKIYRAKYVPIRIAIDFYATPNIVNESTNQKNWIYNIDNKVFYVHFRNAAKYNAARALFNPSANPYEFIKQYGNGIIEIENKTELSFAVTPSFEVLNNSSTTRLELLSVEENKITAPKGASLRQTYATESLTGLKLTSENIRSIRFSAEQAVIQKIDFELYSDFITRTSSSSWTFLGNHALTKETELAYKRLEPEPDCLSKWLRYNDEAFVRVENYRAKWDGSNVEDDNKIREVVGKYISLSDDQANPLAIETYFPEEGSEDNEFEISNLHLLHMGALDFHIARMLGLGLLDLNETVFDGEYIYMAEYTTYGNLQDGLGAREVQHIYCSLPTALYNERLPLPIDLKEPVPGISYALGTESPGVLTDAEGYSQDGRTRFLSLYNEEIPEEMLNAAFYYHNVEFSASNCTIPVFAGIEYKKSELSRWKKPELSFDREYYNIDDTVDPELTNETRSIILPETGYPLFVHRERENGYHDYSSYGINWFSRATSSEIIHTINTKIKPTNNLLPPTNINAVLIRKESPLLLTSSTEQVMFNGITGDDKTLVRLTFEYNHGQELIDYHKEIDGQLVSGYQELPDNEELFAEDIEILFRNHIPNSVSGKILDIIQDPTNPLIITILTEPYPITSSGNANDTLIPSIPNGLENNFKGSIMLVDGNEYVVHQVDTSSVYPTFTVFKRDVSGALIDESTTIIPDEVQIPDEGSLFLVVENMQNVYAWETSSPFYVNVDHTQIHHETIAITNTDGTTETHEQKFRGIYQNTLIEKVFEKVDDDNDGFYDLISPNADPNDPASYVMRHLGMYKITFNGLNLGHHSQYANANSVDWYNGVVRIHTLLQPNGPRKEFKVVRTENIGQNANLVLYACDLEFPNNPTNLTNYEGKIMSPSDTVISINQFVNYYPGYKSYLYKNAISGLDKNNTLPNPNSEEDVRYTIFGLRSHDADYQNQNSEDYFSKVSVPAIMFAQAIVEPKQPELPSGGDYATRPDFFGKSSYTFKTKYEPGHKPHSVQFNRASDIQILSSIYDNIIKTVNDVPQPTTVDLIIKDIFKDGEEAFYVDRWNNLLSFDYNYPGNPSANGQFKTFENKKLPMPDGSNFIGSMNAFIDAHNNFYNNSPSAVPHVTVPITNLNTIVIPEVIINGVVRNGALMIKDFMKDIIYNCFVPLTEVPVIFDFIKGNDYTPIPKKQVVRDRNGNLLTPTLDPNAEFDMAPMMKRLGASPHETQFTDFGLDGASNAKYFYTVREINVQLKTGDYSPIKGPISLVNTAPPTAPEIIKIIPVLENRNLEISPSIQLQINAYPAVQNIRKINIYRATNGADALSIRTMKLVKVIDIEAAGLTDESQWIFEDDFNDIPLIPYGDPLYYRLTVSRVIKYNDTTGATLIDYAPSEASKFVLTNIVENYSPESPTINYASEAILPNGDLNFVNLFWDETAYKGQYYIYKMNAQGNWIEIARVLSDRMTNGRYYAQQQDSQGNWVQVAVIPAIDGKIYLPLELTNLNTYSLATKTLEGSELYHHFKVLAENTSGMLSTKENILSLYNEETWNNLGGIGDMIIEGTFIIR